MSAFGARTSVEHLGSIGNRVGAFGTLFGESVRVRLLVASLFLGALVLVAGCPGFCGGGFKGANDAAFARGTDLLILCENGGFVADLATDSIEGTYRWDQDQPPFSTGAAKRGDDGMLAFTFALGSGDVLTTPEIGVAPWQATQLGQVARDHADVRCTDLEMRSWWKD